MIRTLIRPLQSARVIQIPIRTTVIVERVHPLTKLRPWENIYDYSKYKYIDFQYRVVRDTDTEKWGNIDVILAEYVEGVGYKGEIVNVPREVAYRELLPAQLALYPTKENIALFEEERKLLVDRPQISPFVMKCRDYLKSILLQIPMNLKLKDWSVTRDNIRIALRRINVMCDEDAIMLEENAVNQDTYKLGEEFNVVLKINPLVDVAIKCVIVPVDKAKLWDEYQLSKRKPKS
ncbi:unnamed protein product [Rotaria magnacalcarata]|uniref:Large ribosomal subunit protein bL9m n=4 Tax=Rotaria magnacalcarata TaxID=392030 RepID=A0A819HFR5_9BILA|nr:unnamed protein product [Rotaria magnacalcarata]CAF1668117.1 unnamed protein product [Rotaria magnacalcarata]CAF2088033.1 unnamed protein product [Rotaria magnacalcarata]CAF2111231.1 unnamed protein product [Rotaria magnacalcarata]CAF3827240.1 unnamed protein product [Rotaria magnacalcarata]